MHLQQSQACNIPSISYSSQTHPLRPLSPLSRRRHHVPQRSRPKTKYKRSCNTNHFLEIWEALNSSTLLHLSTLTTTIGNYMQGREKCPRCKHASVDKQGKQLNSKLMKPSHISPERTPRICSELPRIRSGEALSQLLPTDSENEEDHAHILPAFFELALVHRVMLL